MELTQTLKTTYSVSDFITWQKNGSLTLSPNFQRRPVWKAGAKSYLIDTIIRGLPIPIIFLRDLPSDLSTFSPKREVVDGQQRIRTVISFVAPNYLPNYTTETDDFTLSKSHQKDFGGKRFSELPSEYQQRILDYQFSVHCFPASTDDREILEIFGRMNSTGVKLNAQELRNATFYGEFKTLAFSLAAEQLTRWRSWQVFTEYSLARMDEVELTSELMILVIKGITEKSEKIIESCYKQYDDTFKDGEEVARRVRHVMDVVEDKFAGALKPVFNKKTVFYCLFAALYDLQFGLGSPLKARRPATLPRDVVARIVKAGRQLHDGKSPTDVFEATQRRTSHARSRKLVTDYLRKGVA
jgi:uncharacterized protein with ParB-like and HNH nuclease domain